MNNPNIIMVTSETWSPDHHRVFNLPDFHERLSRAVTDGRAMWGEDDLVVLVVENRDGSVAMSAGPRRVGRAAVMAMLHPLVPPAVILDPLDNRPDENGVWLVGVFLGPEPGVCCVRMRLLDDDIPEFTSAGGAA